MNTAGRRRRLEEQGRQEDSLTELVRLAELRLAAQQSTMLATTQRGTALAAALLVVAVALVGSLNRSPPLPDLERRLFTLGSIILGGMALAAFFSSRITAIRLAGLKGEIDIIAGEGRPNIKKYMLSNYVESISANEDEFKFAARTQGVLATVLVIFVMNALFILMLQMPEPPDPPSGAYIVEGRSGAKVAVPFTDCGKLMVTCNPEAWRKKSAFEAEARRSAAR